MRQKIVAGNWKMNGQLQQVIQLSNELRELLNPIHNVQVIVMPPAIYIPQVRNVLAGCKIEIGAQNIYPKDFGAYTGEISAPMLKDYNCRYVLVGHSERRHCFHEDENFVAQKFHHVKEHDMIPVLCVGETLEERESGRTEQVIAKQILAVSENDKQCFRDCIVAYEPVWAIGTGKTALPEQAQEVHQFIRKLIAEINHSDAERLPLLYGGSVNENNAEALFAMPDVDGGLVGGASLNAKQFVEIVKCIN
ncbi:triose-phosphate isomerase [Fluoribacter dumoffii]|uniref:Triosephosphate isomerase n=1 Tax=Fluoribacter dumoffii TaxID=463 RepID=A0A377G602_9GAMM|nr:triose-phosphate isomerase [Fluoribacter dumoffii]KTC91704.1 triosephosphate isomerase [Fluoribacter dumoffii NY 23]MCW8387170.1 triose-phosphate isomerase [Fluoribacter dumoffii]MCW8417325.1 triose-phosphate isomerase [Fluoribacter dumoffii]MCW8454834.1 triose-phosphate isomerase [Fluoribacter dumoffii]MCW8461089.1 triose-phosphate isomerase [Fluoribacter dumoffii]